MPMLRLEAGQNPRLQWSSLTADLATARLSRPQPTEIAAREQVVG
jgi:hypothetical protein